MMKINSLSPNPDRAGKFRVEFSDGSVMRFYRQTVEDFGMYSGMELSDEAYQSLMESAGKMSAKMRAVRIVSASSISKKALQHRLIQKGETPENAELAVEWMSDLSLIDDAKTARQIVEHCIAKGYGISRAKQSLYEKRIPKELWEEALFNYPDQEEKIIAFLQSKLDKNPEAKEVRRVTDSLIRRGHSFGQIRKAMQRLQMETDSISEDFYG